MINYYYDIIFNFFNNPVILIPLVAWFITQTIKVVIIAIKDKKFNFELYFIPGGFPSSHSAFVTALCVVVGMMSGFDSTIFGVSLGFTVFVLYDASVIRRAAQKQARSLNELMQFVNIKKMEPLRDVLGHSFFEVLSGSIIGIATGILMML
ncbi:MAG: divergent PAP2 family protein [Candidatus Pacebacteria bacterium]|nr:divergent PAP2 family protein [Candidatus Paceibacterota bacterium]MDD3919180.1 divergent PAP2 family protein [Candidatus Paceibacterota bacterium]